MLADVSVVCRWCVGGVSTDALADVLADASVGSDSLPLPKSVNNTEWICITCDSNLKKGKLPICSIK